jgi:U3 small nucleolar RNA-associated protein 13
MSQPGRLLHLFTTVAASRGDVAQLAILDEEKPAGQSITGSLEVDQVIKTLPGIDLVRLLRHVRDWNARAKTSPIAQIVLHAILRLRTPDDILAAFDSASKTPGANAESEAAEIEPQAEGTKSKAPAAAANIRELLDALLPYSERHFSRIDRLMQDSYMLDYALSEMDGGVFGAEIMEVNGS